MLSQGGRVYILIAMIAYAGPDPRTETSEQQRARILHFLSNFDPPMRELHSPVPIRPEMAWDSSLGTIRLYVRPLLLQGLEAPVFVFEQYYYPTQEKTNQSVAAEYETVTVEGSQWVRITFPVPTTAHTDLAVWSVHVLGERRGAAHRQSLDSMYPGSIPPYIEVRQEGVDAEALQRRREELRALYGEHE